MALFKLLGLLLCVLLVQGELFPGIQIQEKLDAAGFGKIIEGSPAGNGQFPHQVHLRMESATVAALCGGSLISTRHVLTAAHCLVGMNVVYVRVGTTSLSSGTVIESRNFMTHPQYSSQTLNNDLGLITLPYDVEVSDTVRPIRLPRQSEMGITHDGRTVTVSGWGYTSNSGPISQTLNFVNLNVISNPTCAGYYGTQVIIDSTICCVGINSPAQSTCSGDSGGPLITDDSDGDRTQIGVVSFVSGAGCSSGGPSGYVRTVYFLDWINQNTGIPIRP